MARSRTHAARMDWRRDSQHQKVGRYCARTSGSEVTSLHQTTVNTVVGHWRVDRGVHEISRDKMSDLRSETDLCKLVPGLQWSSGTPATLRL